MVKRYTKCQKNNSPLPVFEPGTFYSILSIYSQCDALASLAAQHTTVCLVQVSICNILIYTSSQRKFTVDKLLMTEGRGIYKCNTPMVHVTYAMYLKLTYIGLR